jgi:hypothetical protein
VMGNYCGYKKDSLQLFSLSKLRSLHLTLLLDRANNEEIAAHKRSVFWPLLCHIREHPYLVGKTYIYTRTHAGDANPYTND